MCTVLQQHLNQTNGFGNEAPEPPVAQNGDSSSPPPLATSTPAPSSSARYFYAGRHVSPVRMMRNQPTYSYLTDDEYGVSSLKRPIDPYDRKVSTPTMHFHVPGPEAKQSRGRAMSYMQQLRERRSRSHSRSGMRRLVEQMQASTPRPKSPHMNNEEAIELSHYPDGRAPSEHGDAGRAHPIERDDFPAPPYAYATPGGRRRHWSEPSSTVSRRSSGETTPVQSSDEEDEEAEAEALADPKLDRTEEELKKMGQGAGMGQIFLKEIEAERERRKQARHRMLDPRSAARTPTARKEPHFRLRYDSPIGASPSRIADHLRPWDDELDYPPPSRAAAATPFLPTHPSVTPHPPAHANYAGGLGGQRAISPGPVNPIRPGYSSATPGGKAQTLPSRLSPAATAAAHGGATSGYESSVDGHVLGDKTYSTDFSSARSDDLSKSPVNGHHHHPTASSSPRGGAENIRVSSTYTQGLQAATPRSRGAASAASTGIPTAGDFGGSNMQSLPSILQAPNIYPLHLLFTTNYRLPGDVDRCNLEKHLSDAEFDMVFRMAREDFYRLPYWKRCDLKRRYYLF